MNRLLLWARIVIACLLLLGVFGIVGLLLLKPVTLSADAKMLADGAIGQLVLLLAFAIHAIYHAGAQVPENPTQPAQPANH